MLLPLCNLKSYSEARGVCIFIFCKFPINMFQNFFSSQNLENRINISLDDFLFDIEATIV